MTKWIFKKASIKKKADNIEYYISSYWSEIDTVMGNIERGYISFLNSDIDDIDLDLSITYKTPLEAVNAVLKAYGWEFNQQSAILWREKNKDQNLNYEIKILIDMNDGEWKIVNKNDKKYQQYLQGKKVDLFTQYFNIVISKK